MTKTVGSAACTCEGTTPTQCVDDDETVTQWSIDGPYAARPRPDKDDDKAVSVVRGRFSPVEAFEESVGHEPGKRIASLLKARYARAGDVRTSGLAVVHTPSVYDGSPHCSVVYPKYDPLVTQDPEWPTDVSIGFDNCFDEA